MLKFFDMDPASGMEKIRIRDGKSRIRDVYPGSATLVDLLFLDITLMTYSIFMAIMTMSGSPGATLSPGPTITLHIITFNKILKTQR
jgi:hypothetical protein